MYAIAFVEFDFQYDCWRIHVFEIVYDLNILKQVIEKITRLKNFSKIVYLYEYVIKSTFDDKTIMRNINKIISQIITKFNRFIFHDDSQKIANKTMKIENWIRHENKIYFYAKAVIRFNRFLISWRSKNWSWLSWKMSKKNVSLTTISFRSRVAKNFINENGRLNNFDHYWKW